MNRPEKFPIAPIFTGMVLLGYSLDFVSDVLSSITCDLKMNYHIYFLFNMLVFILAVTSPLITRTFLKTYSIRQIAIFSSIISIFSWVPLIFSPSNCPYYALFSSVFFGTVFGLFLAFLPFFVFSVPPFSNYEGCSAFLNLGYFFGIFFSKLLFFFTNWQISSIVGFFLSFYFYKLSLKMNIEENAFSLLPSTSEIISSDISDISNTAKTCLLLSCMKYLPGQLLFEQKAYFTLEKNSSMIIFSGITLFGALLCLMFSKNANLPKSWPFISLAISISGIFYYYFYYKYSLVWNKCQPLLVVLTFIRSVFYSFGNNLLPLFAFALISTKSITISNLFIFSSVEWTVYFCTKKLYLLLDTYFEFSFFLCNLLTVICGVIAFFFLRKITSNQNNEEKFPLKV